MTRMAKYIMLPASDVIYNPVNGVNLNMAAAELTPENRAGFHQV